MSSRSMARMAGVLYLVVAVSGGFAQLGARAGLLVSGDPGATADNIRASADAFRLGFAADAINITAFVLMAMLLHRLLAPTSPGLSRAFVVLVAISSTIMGLDLANHAGALFVATDPSFAAAMGRATADAVATLLLRMHQAGYLVAEIFFGLWLVPLGLAVRRSGAMPRWLGTALVVGGGAYLASFALSVTSQDFQSSLAGLVAIPAAVAELALMAWLLVRGVNDAAADAQPMPASAHATYSPEGTR